MNATETPYYVNLLLSGFVDNKCQEWFEGWAVPSSGLLLK